MDYIISETFINASWKVVDILKEDLALQKRVLAIWENDRNKIILSLTE